MSDVATRLRKFILGDSSIALQVGDRVHQAFVPESSEGDFIYFARASVEPVRVLSSGAINPLFTQFDVECISRDLERCQALAALVRSRLDGYRGTFDDSTTQGIFVEDHNDEYVPRATFADDGAHVAAFSVQVY